MNDRTTHTNEHDTRIRAWLEDLPRIVAELEEMPARIDTPRRRRRLPPLWEE